VADLSDHIAKAWRESLRLALLRLLNETQGSCANDSVLATCLRSLGFSASRDQVRTELSWLADQGLVRVQALDALIVASLSDRGAEVAAGFASIPGVQRPGRG
jgi:DNA-binding transcriptional regulator PaaX